MSCCGSVETDFRTVLEVFQVNELGVYYGGRRVPLSSFMIDNKLSAAQTSVWIIPV